MIRLTAPRFEALTADPPLVVFCAKCEREVDRVEVTHNRYNRFYEIRAWCHGDCDTGIVSDWDVASLRPGQTFPDQVAFRTEKIKP